MLDFTMAMAGPFAAQKLGDLGASVIKIEPTGTGEWHRTHAAGNAWVNKLNSSFIAFNRNKRSLSVNLKEPDAAEIVRKLTASADVVLQNFRPGVAGRLGIDFESLRAVNERLVYCSISGYGEAGPYAMMAGQDLVIQGLSGAMWNTGTQGDPPLPSIFYACDATASHLAVEGVVAALYYRERTGKGQKVEVDLLSGVIDMQAQELSVFLTGGVRPTRPQEPLAHALLPAPYGIHASTDGYITVSMGPLPSLGEALDNDWLRSLVGPDDGMTFRDEIHRVVAEAIRSKTSREWLEILEAHGIWAGPVHDYDDLVDDPQVRHNNMIVEMDHPTEGILRVTGIPIRFLDSPGSIRYAPPLVGQHTEEILQSLDYTPEQIHDLKARGIVYRETGDTDDPSRRLPVWRDNAMKREAAGENGAHG